MVKSQPKKHGGLFFWLVFILITAGIGATVLLANNHRNLDLLLVWTGLAPERQMVIPKPGEIKSFKGKRLGSVAVMLPGGMFAEFIDTWQGTFVRYSDISGKDLCDDFRAFGIETTQWGPGSFARKIFECSYETSLANAANPDSPSTFFLMIKGPENGPFQSVRFKIAISDAVQKQTLTRLAQIVIARLSETTGWRELGDQGVQVGALKPFDAENFGYVVHFTREFSGDSYNFIIRQDKRNAIENRTRGYFDRSTFFPLPSEFRDAGR